MRKLILSAALIVLAGSAMAQVGVHRVENGSGEPNATGIENADKWDQGVYHAPQYMPGYPTAATIWPRVVDVPCTKVGDKVICNGYNWTPDMGRGEYLMIHPMIAEPTKPIVVTNTVTNTIVKEVLVPAPVIIPMTTKKIKE